MKAFCVALLAAVLVAAAVDVVSGSRAMKMDGDSVSRRLAQFKITANIDPSDTFDTPPGPNADRTFLRVTDSDLFPEEDDETILQKIINTILGSLEGLAVAAGEIFEDRLEEIRDG